jgi:hypothetical protein
MLFLKYSLNIFCSSDRCICMICLLMIGYQISSEVLKVLEFVCFFRFVADSCCDVITITVK